MKVNRKSGASIFMLFNVLAALVFSCFGAASSTAYAAETQAVFTGDDVATTAGAEKPISFDLTYTFFSTVGGTVNSFEVCVDYGKLVPKYDNFISGYLVYKKSDLNYYYRFDDNNKVYIYYTSKDANGNDGETFSEAQKDIFNLRFSIPETKTKSYNITVKLENIVINNGNYFTSETLKSDYGINAESKIKVTVNSSNSKNESKESSEVESAAESQGASDISSEEKKDFEVDTSSDTVTIPNQPSGDDDNNAFGAVKIVGFTGIGCVAALAVALVLLCLRYVDLYKGVRDRIEQSKRS